MKLERLIKFGRLTALISFLFGTIIFALYCFTSSGYLIIGGLWFIVLTGLFNLALFSIIFLAAFQEKDHRRKLFRTSGLVLLNIPVTILYCWFSLILLNTMRITFVNPNQRTLSDINITGCEAKHVDKLEAGESTTVWVEIGGDCAVDVDYLFNGQRKKEMVVGYATYLMGQEITHIIGKEVDGNFQRQ